MVSAGIYHLLGVAWASNSEISNLEVGVDWWIQEGLADLLAGGLPGLLGVGGAGSQGAKNSAVRVGVWVKTAQPWGCGKWLGFPRPKAML